MKKHPLVMVADDDQQIRTLLKSALELEGFRVRTAPDGNSAMALLEKCKPDLVVLDVMMPGLDGFQVLERVRKQCDIPVIMLTAKHQKTCLYDALVNGADDYVTKPFSTPELVARIRAKLRRAGRSPR